MQIGVPSKAASLIRGLGLWSSIAVIVGSMIGYGFSCCQRYGAVGSFLLCRARCGHAGGRGRLCLSEPRTWSYVRVSGWTSSMIMRPGMSAVIAAGLLRFTGFLLPSVANPIFTWHLTLPFQLQPYQFTLTAAQPLAAAVIVLVTAINYLGVRTAGHFQIFLTSLMGWR
jgi:hypothetical protein